MLKVNLSQATAIIKHEDGDKSNADIKRDIAAVKEMWEHFGFGSVDINEFRNHWEQWKKGANANAVQREMDCLH